MASTTRNRAPLNDDGLTLAEMVVAIGIVMVVLLSSLGVFITVKQAQQTAEGTDRAIQLANSRIERIRQLPWKDIGFYQNTYNSSVAPAGTSYSSKIPSGETTVFVGATEPTSTLEADKIKPYEVTTETGNRFVVHTTITYGRDTALGLPRTSGTTGTGGYSFKRVRVTVEWATNGSQRSHTTVNESWFSPQGYDEAPPGVLVSTES